MRARGSWGRREGVGAHTQAGRWRHCCAGALLTLPSITGCALTWEASCGPVPWPCLVFMQMWSLGGSCGLLLVPCLWGPWGGDRTEPDMTLACGASPNRSPGDGHNQLLSWSCQTSVFLPLCPCPGGTGVIFIGGGPREIATEYGVAAVNSTWEL